MAVHRYESEYVIPYDAFSSRFLNNTGTHIFVNQFQILLE